MADCDVPMKVPPVEAFHHLIIPLVIVPFRLVLPPQFTEVGRANTVVGPGIGLTVTDAGILDAEVQG